ncbi:unnamed protein product [Paramecium octaurelia]|uniref:Uncharacterized protein n=1 Tax=Paramecium octaurelia TaxID=43137 RepID=A0A8S1Y3N8_PAROT|nr:unnamed protein product [Paramecium octaurelia]
MSNWSQISGTVIITKEEANDRGVTLQKKKYFHYEQYRERIILGFLILILKYNNQSFILGINLFGLNELDIYIENHLFSYYFYQHLWNQ